MRFPALWAAIGLLFSGGSSSVQSDPNVIVFRNVSVVPMTEETVLRNRAVLIQGDRILSIVPDGEAQVPDRARTIDGRGLFLMPGLVDAHTHPGGPDELLSYLLYGQTTVFTLDGEGLELRGSGADSPNILTSGRSLDGVPPLNRRFHGAADPGDAAAIVDRAREEGADFLKIYSTLSPAMVAALARAAEERGLALVGHVPHDSDAETALGALGMVAHGEEYFRLLDGPPTDESIARLAALTAEKGVAVTPNLVGYTAMARHAARLGEELADPEAGYLPENIYQEWLHANNRYSRRENIPGFVKALAKGLDALKRLAFALNREGALILAGTDAPVFCFPGTCLLEELELLRESGLSNFEVLKTATANPGRFARETLKRGAPFGTIEPGRRADLILVGGDPLRSLAALRDVRGTMVAGRWRTREDIGRARDQARLALAERRRRIDEYERLISAGDHEGLWRFLEALSPADVKLNAGVVIFDAVLLEREGRRPEAIRLLEHLARLQPGEFAVWNEIGRLKAAGADPAGARSAYRRSLDLQPLNGLALKGLAEAAGE